MANNKEKFAKEIERISCGTVRLIESDDTFRFHCTMCGECCKHRDDILLTAKDLYNIASLLNMSISDVLEKYCEHYIGPNTRLPIVKLKPIGSDMVCPLLEDNKCKVHKGKPFICAAYPIGRATSYEDGNQVEHYVINTSLCGDNSEVYTAKEWFEYSGISLSDEVSKKWNKLTTMAIQRIDDMSLAFSRHSTANLLYTALAMLMYVRYDTSKDFEPQLDNNIAKIEQFFSELETILSAYPIS